MSMYEKDAMFYTKIQEQNRSACHLLLQMSEIKGMVEAGQWPESLDVSTGGSGDATNGGRKRANGVFRKYGSWRSCLCRQAATPALSGTLRPSFRACRSQLPAMCRTC